MVMMQRATSTAVAAYLVRPAVPAAPNRRSRATVLQDELPMAVSRHEARRWALNALRLGEFVALQRQGRSLGNFLCAA
jgi:hypothetical protein